MTKYTEIVGWGCFLYSNVYIEGVGNVEILSEEFEAAVLAKLKAGCTESYEVLLTAHIPIIVKTARNLKKSNETQLSFLDLIDCGREEAEQAINEYTQSHSERLYIYISDRIKVCIEAKIEASHQNSLTEP